MNALIFGSTGLVGKEVLRMLIREPTLTQVTSLSRKASGLNHTQLVELFMETTPLSEMRTRIPPSDVAFCCLGSTIKKAGSKAEFERIDRTLVREFAELARSVGCKKFLVVSALGADASSTVYYNRVKGQMEADLQSAGLESLVILRPSLLLGAREEFRIGEKVASMITPLIRPLLLGKLARLRPVQAAHVAQVMVQRALARSNGSVEIIESDEIQRLAET